MTTFARSPMTAASRITIRHRDQNYGPYSFEQANQLLVDGRLDRDDLAWVEGTPDWTRLGSIPGIVRVPPPPGGGAPRTAAWAAPVSRGPLPDDVSDRQILPAFLLAFFLGVFGVHRFYVGKTGSGIAQLVLTLTLVGVIVSSIWSIVDWILIVCGAFHDAEGRRLTQWT